MLNFDTRNRIIYCSLSDRADKEKADRLIDEINHRIGESDNFSQKKYELITWRSYDKNKVPIYHTDIIQAVFDKHIVICLESIHDDKERIMIENTIVRSGKDIIDLSYDEVNSFCGNMMML